MKINKINNKINKISNYEKHISFDNKKEAEYSFITKDIESLKTKNNTLKKKHQDLKLKEKKLNEIIYYESLENLSEHYTQNQINLYKNTHDYFSKEFFDLVSKLKCEIRKNKFDFSRVIEENKMIIPLKIKILEEKFQEYSQKQIKQIDELKNTNHLLNYKLEELYCVLKKDK